jgi:BASS family bile acid:Na+ symporter
MQITPLLSLFGNLEQLDAVQLNFNQGSVNIMNVAIAFIMFGVALSIKPQHFKTLALNPKSPSTCSYPPSPFCWL